MNLWIYIIFWHYNMKWIRQRNAIYLPTVLQEEKVARPYQSEEIPIKLCHLYYVSFWCISYQYDILLMVLESFISSLKYFKDYVSIVLKCSVTVATLTLFERPLIGRTLLQYYCSKCHSFVNEFLKIHNLFIFSTNHFSAS